MVSVVIDIDALLQRQKFLLILDKQNETMLKNSTEFLITYLQLGTFGKFTGDATRLVGCE